MYTSYTACTYLPMITTIILPPYKTYSLYHIKNKKATLLSHLNWKAFLMSLWKHGCALASHNIFYLVHHSL